MILCSADIKITISMCWYMTGRGLIELWQYCIFLYCSINTFQNIGIKTNSIQPNTFIYACVKTTLNNFFIKETVESQNIICTNSKYSYNSSIFHIHILNHHCKINSKYTHSTPGKFTLFLHENIRYS